MMGRRIAIAISTGKLPTEIAMKAGRKTYHCLGMKRRETIRIPASSTSDEINHILPARTVEFIYFILKVL
jgi:hypothetical protein